MKNYFYFLLILAGFASVATAQVQTPADATADQAITHLREGLVESFNHGDVDRMLTFLDTNAVVTWQNGEVCEGPAAVKAYYDRMMKGDHPIVSKVSADPKVLGRLYQGNWAVSWGNLNDRFVLTDGRELPLNSRFTATVTRRGDHWLVTAFHVSVNAFDNPVLALAVKKVSLMVGVAGVIGGLILGVATTLLLKRAKKSGA